MQPLVVRQAYLVGRLARRRPNRLTYPAEVYIPKHFAAPDDDAVRTLLRHHGAADLVTSTPRGLLATLLPFVHEPGDDGPGRLLGHVARNNEQWSEDGRLVVHDDPAWVESLVRRLTEKHEAHLSQPWSVDDAPPAYVAGQLRAIVGLEVEISRIDAKWKLSQNRSAADVDGVVAGLSGEEPAAGHAVAALMRRDGSSR